MKTNTKKQITSKGKLDRTGFAFLYRHRLRRQAQRPMCFGSDRRREQAVPAADERGRFSDVFRKHSAQPGGGGSRRTIAMGGGGHRKVRA